MGCARTSISRGPLSEMSCRAGKEGRHDLAVDAPPYPVEEPAPLVEVAAVVLYAVPGAPQGTPTIAPVVVHDRDVGDVQRLGDPVDASSQIDILPVQKE